MAGERMHNLQDAVRFKLAERYALDLVKRRFDRWYDYHDGDHSSRVVDKTGEVLTAMNKASPILVPQILIARGRATAAFHDSEQKVKIVPYTFRSLEIAMLERDKRNEKSSAFGQSAYMRDNGFSKEERAGIFEDIQCTVTVPDPNAPGGFYQPNLGPNTSPIGFALAFADLGCAGMEGPAQFHSDGAALFRETFVGVRDLLNQPGLSEEHKIDLKELMLLWLKGQVNFAKGRKQRTAIEIEMLPAQMREPVMALFPHFDESIASAEQNYRLAQDFSLEELATFFGYNADGRLFA